MRAAQHGSAALRGTNRLSARCWAQATQPHRMEVVMKRTLALVGAVVTVVVVPQTGLAQAPAGLDTAAIEQATGLKGQLIAEENVFKVGKARTEVKIQVDQWTMPPFMGLGSWAAFTPGQGGGM